MLGRSFLQAIAPARAAAGGMSARAMSSDAKTFSLRTPVKVHRE
jgi:hypothetical protein